MKAVKYFGALALITVFIVAPLSALARGGGGGSGGGGGGGSHSSGGSGGASCKSFAACVPTFIAYAIFGLIIAFLVWRGQKKIQKEIKEKDAAMAVTIGEMANKDSAWNKDHLIEMAQQSFYEFQRAWGDMDIPALEKILTPDMHKRIALELAVLNNEGRRNPTTITQFVSARILAAVDDVDNTKDSFQIEITATADDRLIETETQAVLFADSSTFTETWDFVRSGDSWKLAGIHQATENAGSLIRPISDFAAKNNFYYNPDFGWLMLPNKGVLFKDGRFGSTDINNHVVGYYRDKIVEFYTMDIWKGENNKTSYFIAQAILPIHHNDILVRRKHFLQFTPSGMVKHEMESNAFVKEFQVCSDPRDNMETFELLTPNFMEYISGLPFEITLEVVGNTLYIATKNKQSFLPVVTTAADYEKMLGILSFAFDEMKM